MSKGGTDKDIKLGLGSGVDASGRLMQWWRALSFVVDSMCVRNDTTFERRGAFFVGRLLTGTKFKRAAWFRRAVQIKIMWNYLDAHPTLNSTRAPSMKSESAREGSLAHAPEKSVY